MPTAGYSGTPLLKKLGIKEASRILLINQPDNYFELLATDVRDQMVKKDDQIDIVHLFVRHEKEFRSEMKKLSSAYKRNPQLVIWVSWYKKAAGIATDITEDTIRDYALANDLVDIKVCAVSDIWSGLKLVVQKAKR